MDHCRIGSLEIVDRGYGDATGDHCRIGSLEKNHSERRISQ